jgi:hypothetical protein
MKTTLRSCLYIFAIAATMFIGSSSRCRAGLVMTVENVTTTAGSLGSFDVLITNTNPSNGASYGVAADAVEIALTGTTGVEFTGVSIATTSAPYIFPVSGTSVGGLFSYDSFPNTQFTVSDSDFVNTAPYEQLIDPGQSYGLVHVSYQVLANAPASMGTISILDSGTSLADFDGNAVQFSTSNGSFIVAGAVPSPPALFLTATGLVLGFLGRLRARVS